VPGTALNRNRDVVSTSVADEFGPVLLLQRTLRSAVRPVVDIDDARTRVANRRPAFDPLRIVSRARTVVTAFDRCIDALEVAGLASSTAVTALRQQPSDPRALALAWVTGESIPTISAQRLAQKAASLVAAAILQSNARVVAEKISFDGWSRPVCPACGGTPDLSVVDGHGRSLICSRCDTSWSMQTRGCLGCNATAGPTITRIRQSYLGYDLVICHACSRYLKERVKKADHPPLVERALTAEMDAAAVRRGLRL
jgi:formate dehydrogenase maturation protein FdhE